MVELNEKAMEAAIDAAEDTYERHEEAGAFVAAVKAAVTVYSSALPEEVVFCPQCGWNSAMDGPALPAPDDGLVELHGCHGTEPTGDDRGHFYCREVWDAIARAEALDRQVQKLTAENERLEANIARLTSHPADHRYWEGRYRDERAENERLREGLNLIDALDPEGQIYGVSHDACRGLIARMGNIARSALETQEGGE